MKQKGLFIKKPIGSDSSEAEEHGLKRHLGSFQLTAIGIGAIIGAGIFVISGQAAAQYAGPAITFSFIIAAVICFFAGLCYAELASMIPASGGSYSYSYIAMGEFPAWIVGWAITAQALFSCSTVAVGWSGYCVTFLRDFGLNLPSYLTSSPLIYTADGGWQISGALINLPAVILVAIVGFMISIGIKAAARFNNIMVVIKLVTVALFIIMGVAYINTDNWTPFVPENTGIFGNFGWSGVLRSAGLLFFAYLGFDTVSTLAQDAVNPQKTLPRGILGSLAIATLAYILTALVLTGVVSYKMLNVPDPMSIALNAMGSSFVWLKAAVKLAILAGLASVVLVQSLGLTRIFLSIGKDGLLPHRFSTVNKSTRTPLYSSVVISLVTLIASGLFPVNVLAELVSMTTLLLFAIVCLGVLILRYNHREMKRPFKVPLVPFIPLAGILCCVFQMACLPLSTWFQLIGWMAIGLGVYFFYGVRHSKLRRSLKGH